MCFRRTFPLVLPIVLVASCSASLEIPEHETSTPFELPASSTATDLVAEFPSATSTEISTPLPDFGRYWVNVDTFPAPDGSSTASILTAHPRVGGGQYYVRLEAHANHIVIDEWRPVGLGYSTPAVLGWSEDARTLYIATEVTPDGCAPFPLLSDIRSVTIPYGRPDAVELELQGPLSLSPGGNLIATVASGQLVIHSLGGDLVAQTDLALEESDRAGSIVWSSSSRRIGFVIQRNACNGEVVSEISIATIPELSLQQVAVLNGQRAWAERWIGERMLFLEVQGGNQLMIDTQSGVLYGP